METVIKIENLSKEYRLGQVGTGTISHDLNRWWHKIRGKEDPYLKLGETNDRARRGLSDYVYALKDINLEVKKGEVLGIIGKNGAGKSTLLKILSKVTGPTIGKIKTRGRIASLLEIGTGFHPELTGRENIYMNGTIMGMTRREINSKLSEIIDFAGIERYIDTPTKRYSSGMTVRLGFAIAAHLEPEILVVDEVLAVGDAEFQKKAIGKMQDISEGGGRTVLFVSHNMEAIRQLCDRVVVLKNGSIFCCEEDVEDGIVQYLKEERKDLLIQKDLQFEDDIIRMINFRFVDIDGNQTSGNITNNTDIFVEIQFDLKRKDSAFNIGYALYGAGQLYYWTMSTDSKQSEWPKLSIGKNIIRSAIPKRHLNEGNYIIKLYSSLHFIKAIINPDYDSTPSLYLTIEGGLSDSPYWYSKRPGLCAPVIKWERV